MVDCGISTDAIHYSGDLSIKFGKYSISWRVFKEKKNGNMSQEIPDVRASQIIILGMMDLHQVKHNGP